MRKRKPIHEQRTSRVMVSFTEEERLFIASEAKTCGLSAAVFVRLRSLGKCITPKSDLRVISELLRIGGLLKHLHNETKGAYSALTSKCLKDITACISRIKTPAGENEDKEQ
ncbi:hypothetical protein FACS1894216_20710 [Synergistales bacterium]|nr:hypothetical protein FACS1894216_20710 [Synergistales bacterium]